MQLLVLSLAIGMISAISYAAFCLFKEYKINLKRYKDKL